jgi:hypothetical protein
MTDLQNSLMKLNVVFTFFCRAKSKFPVVVVASDADDAVVSSGAGDVDDGDSSVVEVLADAVDVVVTVFVLVVEVVVDVGNLDKLGSSSPL